ncbi:hypothetical protein AA23498_2162 [Acetobacter nitrogenifigens DSM 23921 = NBRC 105050]|uniref:Tyr recombinase domain-containing protein n=1 Tax=Acetobacter nitrogenifigens DSM 23921 = NBRC 105050 TaxID=1120919 RepID=A0A511X6U1_9PROT|nr:tyrosine-type recombinase/integrase [Acetobacter nitrogenifigens]GBQ94970.1 hypothetical protein AA23498_2162 [Acetobacter nitrogenifigens DSM 23921 = NBRC 105050]GEN58666.1 hypothetical protein ANI02nite_05500 [Acetobacter nitrogenifigens DSM 23921 = NBRC 105050]
MRGLKPIGRTYYARLLIPKDRQRDVGTAYGVKSGIVEERVRTTGTQDKREAIKRRDVVLAALTHEVNAKLTAAGLPPLHGEWKPDWLNEDVMISEAMEARQALRALSDVSDEKDEIDGWTSPRSREESNFRDLIIDRAAEMTEQGVSGVGEYVLRSIGVMTGTATPFSVVLDRWIKERRRDVSAAMVAMDNTSLRHFGNYLAISQGRGKPDDPVAFLRVQTIQQVPDVVTGEFSEWLTEQGLSPKTVSRIISPLKVLWDWAIHKKLIPRQNPWVGATSGLKKRAERERRAQAKKEREFHEAELIKLLTANPNEGHRGVWSWTAPLTDLMRIALLTGARENELCSLTVGRIVNRDGANGLLWGIEVTEEHAKTENSVRKVPLHPLLMPIIERRLRDAEATGEPDAVLFPECKPGGVGKKRGHVFSQRFTDLRRAVLGVESNGVVNFHSFRKSFGTFMRRAHLAGVSECQLSVAQKLLGHKPQTITEAVYMEDELQWAVCERAILGMVESGMPEGVREALGVTGEPVPGR